MRAARLRMAPPVPERVELLDIAELDAGLPLDPFAQADLERAVRPRRERAEGKGVARAWAGGPRPCHEDVRLLVPHRDDGGVQAEFDLRIA